MSDLEYGFVPGRSKAKALALLAAARKAGVDETLVKARTGGYDVPTSVLDGYEAELKKTLKAEEADKAPNETLAPGTAEEVIASSEAADEEQRELAAAAAEEEERVRLEQEQKLEEERLAEEAKAAQAAKDAEAAKAAQTAEPAPKTKPAAKSKGAGK